MFVMDTTTFSVLGIPPYFFMAGIGMMIAYAVFATMVSWYTDKVRDYSWIVFISMLGLLLGGGMFGLAVAFLNALQSQDKITAEIFRESGNIFYGGLTGFLVMYRLLQRVFHTGDGRLDDITAICIPCFHSFARIGCFMSGCCYGKAYNGWGAVYYINFDSEMPRFPVQLAEAFAEIVLFAVLLVLFYRKKRQGKLLYIYLCMYALLRFALEFLRGDVYRGIYFGLSFSQWYSLCVLVFVWVHFQRKIRDERLRVE